MTTFHDLPVKLRGCCVACLDSMSVGRFGQASKACYALVEGRFDKEKAAHARAAPFEKSKYGAFVTYRNPIDGCKLVTFSDGGAKLYRCECSPGKECSVGTAFSSVACHLFSRKHWKHWRLVAFGEAQPTEDVWLAFVASSPLAPRAVHRI